MVIGIARPSKWYPASMHGIDAKSAKRCKQMSEMSADTFVAVQLSPPHDECTQSCLQSEDSQVRRQVQMFVSKMHQNIHRAVLLTTPCTMYVASIRYHPNIFAAHASTPRRVWAISSHISRKFMN